MIIEQPDMLEALYEALKPEPMFTVTEWANERRILSEMSALPGRYSTKVTPYLEEPMNRMSVQDPAQKIIFKKSSQIGATEMGNNWMGYIIDISPAPTLYVMPTDTMMKYTSKNRIAKMLQSTVSLHSKINVTKSRDKDNTLLYKEFLRGFLMMVGANSPVGLASTPVRYVYMDEIDGYPSNLDGEGSALGLAETRTMTFGSRKKMLLTSTPRVRNSREKSAICEEFDQTGQRYFHVPCPHCGHLQPLNIDQLRYGPTDARKYTGATYECIECHEQIDERYKGKMLNSPAANWVPKYPEKEDGITYGYFINALYSPSNFYTWGNLLQDRDKSMNDLPKKTVFYNTKLGELYVDESSEKVDWEALHERYHNQANIYEKNKPFASVVFITAGVDVQDDRLEVQICGWMKDKSCQVLDYRVLPGNAKDAEVWKDLEQIITEVWISEDGKEIPLSLMAVDSGDNTQIVYSWVDHQKGRTVIPIKGSDTVKTIFTKPNYVNITREGKATGKVLLYRLGVSVLKSDIYARLGRSINKETGEVPAGYMYIPDMDVHYFKSLTAEEVQLVTNKKGYDVGMWVKKYKRNEVLDTIAYARAAASIYGLDRWTDAQWDVMAGKLKRVEEKALPVKQVAKKKSVWDGWRD